MQVKHVVQKVLDSKDPIIKLKCYLRLLEHEYDTKEVKKITSGLKTTSPIISTLFSYLPMDDKQSKLNVYRKWHGVHWILADLADIGYPPGDKSLYISRDYELNWLFSKERWSKKKTIQGRKRFCASQEGNALFSILSLGLDDGRCKQLVERLIKYQWEGGGWNCDRRPEAFNSSFHESLIPLRALNKYSQVNKNDCQQVIDRAAEIFLKRKLFKQVKNNEIIHPEWIKLHYPPYWKYDIFFALKVLSEAGKINDPRCLEALELLEAKRLPNGGFPAEARNYTTSIKAKTDFSPVNWGGVRNNKMNEWVTIDALYVLKKTNHVEIEI